MLAAAAPAFAVASALLIVRALSFREAVFMTALLAGALVFALIGPSERAVTILLTVLLLALFTPSLGGQNSTPIRAEDIVIAATGCLLLIGRVPIRLRELEAGFVALAAVAALAMLGSSFRTDLPASWADLNFFLRLVKYALVAIVVRQLVPRLGRHHRRVLPIAMVFFSVFALVGVAQYFGSATATRLFPVVSSRADLLLQEASWRRAVGPIGNSNYFGFVCAIGCVISFAQVAYARTNFRGQIVAAMAICASVAGIVTSGSRTALLAAALMVGVVLFPIVSRIRAWRNIVGVVVGITVGAALLGHSLQSQPVYERFRFLWSSSAASGDSLVSFEERRQVWAQAISDAHGHWLFGLGPGKGVLTQWVDNDFIRIFRDFGSVGVTAYVVMLAWWVLRWVRSLRVDFSARRNHVLALALLLGTIVMGGASDVFYQPQVMGILVMLLAFLTTAPPRGETP